MAQHRLEQKGDVVRAGLVVLLRAYLSFTLRTTRWTISISPKAAPYLMGQNGKTAIVALWHEILPLGTALWWWAEPQNSSLKLSVLISRNHDGRMIASIIAPWRIKSIAGSSDNKGKSKGGAAAFRQMLATLKRGEVVVITPDGPRGPRRVVQQGVINLTVAARQPVVPMGGSSFGLRLKTWDRMLVPLPFGKGHIVCGDPVHVSSKTTHEALRLGDAINAQMLHAERNHIALSGTDYEAANVRLKFHHQTPSRLWYALATLLAPALPFLLRWRQGRGKELPARVREKMGFASLPRPNGKLLWFHAASVGEVLSVLPLVNACLAQRYDSSVLLTTGTVTAAKIVNDRIKGSIGAERIFHQFVPFDVPRWGKRFLDHWHPDAVVLTESDLWPNLIGLCHAQNIPTSLVNGRMSDRSFRAWKKCPEVSRRMLQRFAWIAPRSVPDALYFEQLSGRSVGPVGDIKTLALPLPVKEDELRLIKEKIGARPVFLAASTHDGEEVVLAEAVALLQKTHPSLLTVVVPRHPERGASIAELFGNAPRRSCNQWPSAKNNVWVCDTLGELGLFYRLAHCAFIGNSLFEAKNGGGGHNPFEPVRLGCPAATGPKTHNFSGAFAGLGSGIVLANNAQQLAFWVSEMLSKPGAAKKQADLAFSHLEQHSALLGELTMKILGLLVV